MSQIVNSQSSKLTLGVISFLIIFGLSIGLFSFYLVKSHKQDETPESDYSYKLTELIQESDVLTIEIPSKVTLESNRKFTLDTFPRIDSSTSNQHIVYSAFCELTDYTCDEYEFEGEKFVSIKELGYEYDYGKPGEKETFEDRVRTSKTHGAYVNLINGDSDLILVASLPSEEEQQLARDEGVKLVATPIAKDAFIFLKNSQNPVSNLTTSQIRKIYSGETTNWSEIGGQNKEITAYVRNANSGSQETMKALVMKDANLIEMEEMMIPTMIELVNKLDTDEAGLGYSFYYYKNAMTQSDNVELMSVDDVEPSKASIASGEYPFTTDVYLVIREEELDDNTARLKLWLLSDAGQKIIEEVGYVGYFDN